MSDSEDEGAFQSADEGEGANAGGDKSSKKDSKKKDSSMKPKTDTAKSVQMQKTEKVVTQQEKTSNAQVKNKSKGKKKQVTPVKKEVKEGTKETEGVCDSKVDVCGSVEASNVVGQRSETDASVRNVDKTVKEESELKDDVTFGTKSSKDTKLNPKADSSEAQSDKEIISKKSGDTRESNSEPIEKDITEAQYEKNPNEEKHLGTTPTEMPEPPSMDHDVQEGDEKRGSVLERLTGAADNQSGGGWSSWGNWGTSLLSTATASVTTFTHQVGEGITTVLETVDSTLGAPDPEDLVEQQRAARDAVEPEEVPNGQPKHNSDSEDANEDRVAAAAGDAAAGDDTENKAEEENSEKKDGDGGWWAWGATAKNLGLGTVSTLSETLQKTTKSVMSGGLDVLETIGKKTYSVLAEGEHGLIHTMKAADKPNLSQVLRDAQADYEETAKKESEYEEARKAHFGSIFDELNGVVHLEALELVSNQCEGKVNTLLTALPNEKLKDIMPHLITIRGAFVIEENEDDESEALEHDFTGEVTNAVGDLGVKVSPDKLVEIQHETRKWLADCSSDQEKGTPRIPKDIHQKGMQSLAELTASTIQLFHKISQLLQMTPGEPMTVYKARAECLKKLMLCLGMEVEILSSKFTECLNTAADDSEEPDSVNPLITNVYLEATNSKTYIQDAFQLLLPIVHQTALEAYATVET